MYAREVFIRYIQRISFPGAWCHIPIYGARTMTKIVIYMQIFIPVLPYSNTQSLLTEKVCPNRLNKM